VATKSIANSCAFENSNEFEFRWNTRKMSNGQRVSAAIKQVDGSA
jgi:hypothetical protein